MAHEQIEIALGKDRTSTREMMQRVQVGLVGLLGVLAIIALANLMTHNARVDDSSLSVSRDNMSAADAPPNSAAATAPASNNEPLADLGVTPSSDPTLGATPAVPDLEPDPRLTTPMDRDPRRAPQQKQ